MAFISIGDVVCESLPAVYTSPQAVEDAFRAVGRPIQGDVFEYPSGEFVLSTALEMGMSLEDVARLYTLLEDCVDHTINPEDETKKDVKVKSTARVTSDFTTRLVFTPFYSPVTRSYRYVRIEIRESRVKVAGKGAFAGEPLNEGEYGFYRGQVKTRKTHNHAYSWELNDFRANGTARGGKVTSYLDASSSTHSNWARYVNCANFDFKNNMGMVQRYHTLSYVTSRDIDAGEELFIDYGTGYRTANLDISESTYDQLPQCWECGGDVVFMEDRLNYYAHANYFQCASCDEKMVWCDEGFHSLPLEESYYTNRDFATVVCAGCEGDDPEGEGDDPEGEDDEGTLEDEDLRVPIESLSLGGEGDEGGEA